MLERTSACLDSGVRVTVQRGARQAHRSRRMLHSTFFDHGASRLDLPPWMIGGKLPERLPFPPLRYDDTHKVAGDGGDRTKRSHSKHDSAPLPMNHHIGLCGKPGPISSGPVDCIFLPFLYPPQALVWASKKNSAMSCAGYWERWEKRNARRLPDGFIHAHRVYSSQSGAEAATVALEKDGNDNQTRSPVLRKGFSQGWGRLSTESKPLKLVEVADESGMFEAGKQDDVHQVHDVDGEPGWQDPHTGLDGETQQSSLSRSENISTDNSSAEYADSAGNMAEPVDNLQKASWYEAKDGAIKDTAEGFTESPDGLAKETHRLQRQFCELVRGLHGRKPQSDMLRSQLAEQAWNSFRALDLGDQRKFRLQQLLVQYLAWLEYEPAAERIVLLFEGLPKEKKSLAACRAAALAYLQLGRTDQAKMAWEAVVRQSAPGPGGEHRLVRLLTQALRGSHWDLAVDVYERYIKHVDPAFAAPITPKRTGSKASRIVVRQRAELIASGPKATVERLDVTVSSGILVDVEKAPISTDEGVKTTNGDKTDPNASCGAIPIKRDTEAIIWDELATMPDLVAKATDFLRFLSAKPRNIQAKRSIRQFGASLIQTCFKVFLDPDLAAQTEPSAYGESNSISAILRHPRSQILLRLFRKYEELSHPGRLDVGFHASSLSALLALPDLQSSRSEGGPRLMYSSVHPLASFVYNSWTVNDTLTKPSTELLHSFLRRVTASNAVRQSPPARTDNVTIDQLINDWGKFHGSVSSEALESVMTHFARLGLPERVDQYRLRLESQSKIGRHDSDAGVKEKDRGATAWLSIYVHARRVDLRAANKAFREVKERFGVEPDIRCWNSLIHAHARADDLDGALELFQRMASATPAQSKPKPDAFTFGPVAELYASRGDPEGVEDLLDLYDNLNPGESRTTAMFGSLITAHVQAGDLHSAQKVLKDVIKDSRAGRVRGELTDCFNDMMTAFARTRTIGLAISTYHNMRDYNVPLNSNTFAAIMQALCVYRQSTAAANVLFKVMPSHGFHPTSFHYAVVMAGFVNQGMYRHAIRIHRIMERKKVKPSVSSKMAHLKALALQEHVRLNEERTKATRDGLASEDFLANAPLTDTVRHLEQLVMPSEPDVGSCERLEGAEAGRSDLAANQPVFGIGPTTSLATAVPTVYFDFLIYLHGKRRCFEAAKLLYRQYLALASSKSEKKSGSTEGADVNAQPPIRLMTSLMSVYLLEGDHAGVEQCWKLIHSQAEEVAKVGPIPSVGPISMTNMSEKAQYEILTVEPPDVDEVTRDKDTLASRQATELVQPTTKPSPLAQARRQILSRPLRYYLSSLAAQSRVLEALKVVSSLLSRGWTLDTHTWNFLISMLCGHDPPMTLLAFTLTERYLVPFFPGWTRNISSSQKPSARWEGLENISARYLGPGKRMPKYKTMVRLAAALLALRRAEARGRGRSGTASAKGGGDLDRYVGTLRTLKERAPKTLYAVQSMPYRKDVLQRRLLRGEE